jgi:hypothetical protein
MGINKMRLFSIQLLIGVLLLLPVSLNAQETKSAICSEFRNHLNKRAGLVSYAVDEKQIKQEEFNFTIPSIDVDGDNIEDKILLFRPGSGSVIPADSSSVTLILSSTGKKYTAEMQRFFVILYKLKYYLVASNLQSEEGPEFIDIKSMDRNGIKQLCSYKCTIRGGSCVSRQ